MPESSEHAASRRILLGHLAGAAAASGAGLTTAGAAAATSADAELIEACATFIALERRLADADEHAAGALVAKQRALVPVLCGLRARTPEGSRARAAALLAWAPDLAAGAEVEGSPWDERLRAALLRDLVPQ